MRKKRALSKKEDMREKRASQVIIPQIGDRKICMGTRHDGFPCTFRAKNNNGYCQRHDPYIVKDISVRVMTAKEKICRNKAVRDLFRKRWANLPTLPQCPTCGQFCMIIEEGDDEEPFLLKFGLAHTMCTSCGKRMDLYDVVKLMGGDGDSFADNLCAASMNISGKVKPEKEIKAAKVKKTEI